MKRLIIACIAVVASAVPCLAQLKSERLPAASGVTLFSMDVHDVTPDAAIAAFRKQTGINVVYDSSGFQRENGPAVLYDVKFDKLPANAAVREVARCLALGLVDNGDGGLRLSRNSWSGDDVGTSLTTGVTLVSVTRTQTVPPAPEQPDSINLGVRVSAGDKPTDGSLGFKLETAADDQGRGLDLMNNDSPSRYSGWNPSNEVTLQLTLPKPRPKKLAIVRGVATVGRPKTILRVSCDKLPDAAVDCPFEGGTLTIGPLAAQGKGFELPISFTRGTMSDERWNAVTQQINRLNSAMNLAAADGTPLMYNNGGWSSGGDVIRINGRVGWPYNGGHDQNDAVPRPTKLTFDTVVESESEPISFEFKDVVVP